MISDSMKAWAEMIRLQETAPTTTTDIHLIIMPHPKPLNKKRRGLPGVKVSRLRVKHHMLSNAMCRSVVLESIGNVLTQNVEFTFTGGLE